MKNRKLKLEAESLQVQTFGPESVQGARGTAFGYSGAFGPGCRSEWPNCIEYPDSGVYGPNCPFNPPNCN